MNLKDFTGLSLTSNRTWSLPKEKNFIKSEEKRLPSKAKMASNFTKSVAKTAGAFVSGKKIVADISLRNKRIKICEGCPWYIKEKQRCAECGCLVPLKTYFEEESCPIERW